MGPCEDQTQMFMARASLGYRFWRKKLWTVYFYFKKRRIKISQVIAWCDWRWGTKRWESSKWPWTNGALIQPERYGGCFLVLIIFMASSEKGQNEWEVEFCVEAQCHWGGQSTKDSTELNCPPLNSLLPQRAKFSKLFSLSLWWRCHLETDLFPSFLMLYLEIIAYLQGCGKNSTESLIHFPPSFTMVATRTTPLQLKKNTSKLTWNKNVS